MSRKLEELEAELEKASGRVVQAADEPLRALLVEDSLADARLLQETLNESSRGRLIELTHVKSRAEAIQALAEADFDCILLDLGLADGQGLDNVEVVREHAQDTTLVVMTGNDSDQTAMATLNLGAQEYIVKGMLSGEALARTLRHALERNRMVLELQALREREYFLATHDALTGLPNRKLFGDRAAQGLAQAKRKNVQAAICYLDLDGFKPINDNYGHDVGDRLLIKVAEALGQAVRDGDTVARIGGDEFAIMLGPLHDRAEAQQIAARMIERVRGIAEAGGRNLSVSASIGMALFPEHGTDQEQLLLNADAAMYSAKAGERGVCLVYSPKMKGERELKGQMIDEINQALREDKFFPHYQPWVDGLDGITVGVQVLARWMAPGGQVRHPHLFLPIAEASGLINRISRRLVAGAADQWRRWQSDGLAPGLLGINLSARELSDADYVDELTQLLEQRKVRPGSVQLQLSRAQEALEAPPSGLHEQFERLKQAGFRLCLGEISRTDALHAALESLPIDALRMDRHVLGGIEGALGEQGRVAISEALALSRAQDFEVIVGGVETRLQYRTLSELGVRYMQGFLFGAPGDASHAEGLIRSPRVGQVAADRDQN